MNTTKDAYIQLQEIKYTAVNALHKLNKIPDNCGNYPYLHVSFSDNDRVLIYMCPVMKSKYIVHEIYGSAHSVSSTRHLPLGSVKKYIESLDTIKYIAITEHQTQYDTMRVLYEQPE